MRSTTHYLSISTARADALFVSALQRSEEPSAVQVHMHVGGWWQRTGPFGRRIPEHPVQEDSVIGSRAPAHQVKRLSDVVAVERAGVAEVGHRAGVRDQFEAGRVQREVVPVRRPSATGTVRGSYWVVVSWSPGATYSELRADQGAR